MAEMFYRPASDKSSCLTVLLTTKIDETTKYSGGTGKTVLLSCFRTACRGLAPERNVQATDITNGSAKNPPTVSQLKEEGHRVFFCDDLTIDTVVGHPTKMADVKCFFFGTNPYEGCRTFVTSNLGLVASVTKDGEAKNVQVAAKAFARRRCQPEDYQPVTRRFDVYTIEKTTDEVDIAWLDAFKDNYFLRLAFASSLRRLFEDRELIFTLQQDDEDHPAGEIEELDFELYEKAETFD
ncbi:hypothetical protein HDE_07664 [Halotydeus destructor]|nr:hypothetical protein HDE_07664 [Halotydeus destructor]